MRNAIITKIGYAAFLVILISFASQHCSMADDYLTTVQAMEIDNSAGGETEIYHLGRLPFRVSASVRTGYDDNVLTTSIDRQGSWFTDESASLSYDFGSPRTQVNLRTGGGVTYYFDRPGDHSDVNAFFGLSLTHKASPRLMLGLSAYVTYQSEPDFALNAGLDRRSGNFLYTLDKVSVAYQWTPRFSTVPSYTLGRTSYDNEATAFFQDRFEHTLGNEFRYLIWPTTTLVGEYRFQIIDYDSQPGDSTTHFALAGFDHTFSPHFNISVRGGVEFRSYDVLGDKTDPYFESTLIYVIGPHTSITWTNHYSIEEPDVIGSSSQTTFRTGLQVRYNVTERIVTGLSFYYQHDENAGIATTGVPAPSFAENSFMLALSAKYAINRTWAVEIGYDFSDIESNAPLRSYYRNRISAGVNLSF